jgi:hypothetical protein
LNGSTLRKSAVDNTSEAAGKTQTKKMCFYQKGGISRHSSLGGKQLGCSRTIAPLEFSSNLLPSSGADEENLRVWTASTR